MSEQMDRVLDTLRPPVPTMSEWEIRARRAIFECDQQLGAGTYNIHTIRHMLTDERN